MSSETRIVRPYVGVGQIQSALEFGYVHIGSDSVSPNGRQTVQTLSYLAERVILELATEDHFATFGDCLRQGIAAASLSDRDVELIAVLRTPRLRSAEVVWRRLASELSERDRVVRLAAGNERPRALRTPHGGCEISLYAVLSHNLNPQPLRPFRKGTWLGRAVFRLVTDLADVGFIPIPLDDHQRTMFGLPKGTLRYVVVEEVLDPEAVVDSVQLYVDEHILAELTLSPFTPGAKTFQRQLFLDTIRAIVHLAARELSARDVVSIHDIEGSVTANLIQRVAGQEDHVNSDRRQQLLARLCQHPEWFVAQVEATIDHLARDLSTSVKEGGR
jgi:hypothetical protein